MMAISSRSPAKSKVQERIVEDFLYVDNAALLYGLSKACRWFELTISLKKTAVLPFAAEHEFFINDALLENSDKCSDVGSIVDSKSDLYDLVRLLQCLASSRKTSHDQC